MRVTANVARGLARWLLLFVAIYGIIYLLRGGFLLSAVVLLLSGTHAVPMITSGDLQKELSLDSSAIVLFDTRSPEEFETSHIRNAIRLDEDVSGIELGEKYGAAISGRNVVFYCSVGYRSAKVLRRITESAVLTGARSVRCLEGGIFDWYMKGNEVVNDSGTTASIHPHGIIGKLLVRERE